MSLVITDNTVQVISKNKVNASLFLRSFADEVIKISTPKTPKKTGQLRRDVLKSVVGLSGKIKWGKNYAAKQESKQHKNYTTPGTGPHYAENAVKNATKKSVNIAKRVGLI